jgi:hypothetical protein
LGCGSGSGSGCGSDSGSDSGSGCGSESELFQLEQFDSSSEEEGGKEGSDSEDSGKLLLDVSDDELEELDIRSSPKLIFQSEDGHVL